MGVRIIIAIMIAVQIIINFYFIYHIECLEDEIKACYKSLRKEFDIKIDNLQKDIELELDVIK